MNQIVVKKKINQYNSEIKSRKKKNLIDNQCKKIKKSSPIIEAIDVAYMEDMRKILTRQNLVDLMSYESVNPSVRTEEHWLRLTRKYSNTFVCVCALKVNGQLEVIIDALQAPINLTKIDLQAFRIALIKEIDPMYKHAIFRLIYSDKYNKPLPVYNFKINQFTGDRTHQMWI